MTRRARIVRPARDDPRRPPWLSFQRRREMVRPACLMTLVHEVEDKIVCAFRVATNSLFLVRRRVEDRRTQRISRILYAPLHDILRSELISYTRDLLFVIHIRAKQGILGHLYFCCTYHSAILCEAPCYFREWTRHTVHGDLHLIFAQEMTIDNAVGDSALRAGSPNQFGLGAFRPVCNSRLRISLMSKAQGSEGKHHGPKS